MKTLLHPSPSHGSRVLIRWVGPPVHERLTVDCLPAVLRIWREHVASGDAFDASKEHLVVIGMNRALHFIGWHLVAMGNERGVTYTARDVLRAALLMDASAVLMVHNHPSGKMNPSHDDIRATVQMKRHCATVGIEFIGHAIVNSEGTQGIDIDHASANSQAVAAEPLRHDAAITYEGPGERVNLSLPRAWLRMVGSREEVRSCFYQEARAAQAADQWVRQWNASCSDIRRFFKQHSTYRLRRDMEFIIAAADLEKIREAAGMVGVSDEDMLAAIAGRACANVTEQTRIRAEAHAAATSNVVEFRPVHSNACPLS